MQSCRVTCTATATRSTARLFANGSSRSASSRSSAPGNHRGRIRLSSVSSAAFAASARIGYRTDLASAEIAKALVETGRSLSYLHVLIEALDMRGARRGYLDGALVAGRLCSALATDANVDVIAESESE